jgi:hypothetical protein
LDDDMLKVAHVRKTVSYLLLAKAMFGGAFLALTFFGITLPIFGIHLTSAKEIMAMGIGGALGAMAASIRA